MELNGLTGLRVEKMRERAPFFPLRVEVDRSYYFLLNNKELNMVVH